MTLLKTIILRLSLLAFGLLMPLLMLEIGVRVTGLAPPTTPNPSIWQPHPLFGWWHIPHSGGQFYSPYSEFSAEVRINARGLRDREIGYDVPTTDTLRILSLADSFGEALQVDLEQTYHKRLESRLTETLARPVEVINAGVGGWGTDQQAIFYVAEGFRYQPDVVLLAFFVRNDVVNNYEPLELARNGGSQQKQFFSLATDGRLIVPSLEPTESTVETVTPTERIAAPDAPAPSDTQAPLLGVADGLWQFSNLYRLLVPHLREVPSIVQQVGPTGILGGEGVVRANHPTTPVPFFVYQTPPPPEFVAAWQLTEAIISRLRDEVTQRGSRLVVVLVSAPEQLDPSAWAQTVTRYPDMQGVSWNLMLPNQRMGAFLERAEIPHVDLLPIFRESAAQAEQPPLHFRYDQHWTADGHDLAAAAIAEFLLTEGLVE